MNVYSIVVQVLVLIALIAYSIQCRRLRSRANKAEDHKLLMSQLLWALAKTKESQIIWIPTIDLPPVDGSAGVLIVKSPGGVTIRTRQQDES